MIDKQAFERCAWSPKVHAGLRDRLLRLAAEQAEQPPPVAVALTGRDTARLPAAVRDALNRPAQSVEALGVGPVVSVQLSWDELRAVIECEQVRFVQLDAPHEPLARPSSAEEPESSREG